MDILAARILSAALVAAQKVEKKFRQLHNCGEVSFVQLRAAKQLVEDYRSLCDALGVERIDIDRGQRKRKSD